MIERLVSALGMALLHSLWQGAVLVALAGLSLMIVGRRPRLRYAVLCGALLALLVAPMVTTIEMAGRSGTTARSATAGRATDVPTGTGPNQSGSEAERSPSERGWIAVPRPIQPVIDRSLPLLVIAWLIGVALGSVRLAGGWLVIRRRIARATRAPAEVATRVATLTGRIGLRRVVRVLVASEVEIPFVAGLIRPVLLLPLAALSGLSPLQLDAILVHELAHVRRWDYLVNLLQAAAETLLFFHPAAWWLSRRIRVEREYCCDDIAVAATADPVSYARALAALEGLRVDAPSMAIAANDGSLTDRIERLVGLDAGRSPTGWVPIALLLICLFAAVSAGQSPRRDPAPAAAQDRWTVVRHPDPAAALADRWRWAFAEGRRRGWPSLTVGWRIRSGLSDGHMVMSSTEGGSPRDRGPTVAALLGGEAGNGVALFFTFNRDDPGSLAAVAVRSMTARLTPREAPIAWLGDAADRESVRLIQELAVAASATMRAELGGSLSLHDEVGLVVGAVDRVMTDEPEPSVRAETAAGLGRHLRSGTARSALRRGLEDASPEVRDEALSALRDGPDGAAILVEVLAVSRFVDVRSEAVQALKEGLLEPDRLVEVLRRTAFDDPSREVRAEAVDALIEIETPAADRVLREIIDRHPEGRLRGEAADALAERGR